VRRLITAAAMVGVLPAIGCSSTASGSAKASAQCQKAFDIAEQASRKDVTPAQDATLGRLQDATLKVCGSTADFTAAWLSKNNLAFNGETKDQSAHDVLAAFCQDPVDPSLTSAAPCDDLQHIDPDAFNRTHPSTSPQP
jgi:hypothetical protein